MLRTLPSIIAILAAATAFGTPVTIETPQGKVQGETSSTSENVAVFKSIPYALPPTGKRRWTHAEPAPDWPGIRLATRFSPICVQPPATEGSFFFRPTAPMSEDCLYLNVWTPAKAGDKLPVMVWIHGGALRTGSGAIGAYDGTALARKGVVVVTINYRLGQFGYFTHPDLAGGSPHGSTGNYGTSDQVKALEWVQRNIGAYGGDAGNVTIFGESAGAWSVHHMMATPLAKGLFHRAIAQSGHQFGPMRSAAEAGKGGLAFQEQAGAASLAELRALDWTTIAATSGRFSPVVDGWIFPDQIYSMVEKGNYNAVPLMAGFNAHEATSLGGDRFVPENEAAYAAQARERYGDLADEYLAVYPAATLRDSALAAARDMMFGWGTQTMAKMNKRDAYVYFFTHAPRGERLGAFHAAEIIYAFNNVPGDSPAADKRLGNIMSDYWVSFAKTGGPAVKGQPKWRPYKHRKGNYMEFGTAGASHRDDLLPGTWEIFDKINARQRARGTALAASHRDGCGACFLGRRQQGCCRRAYKDVLTACPGKRCRVWPGQSCHTPHIERPNPALLPGIALSKVSATRVSV